HSVRTDLNHHVGAALHDKSSLNLQLGLDLHALASWWQINHWHFQQQHHVPVWPNLNFCSASLNYSFAFVPLQPVGLHLLQSQPRLNLGDGQWSSPESHCQSPK